MKIIYNNKKKLYLSFFFKDNKYKALSLIIFNKLCEIECSISN